MSEKDKTKDEQQNESPAGAAPQGEGAGEPEASTQDESGNRSEQIPPVNPGATTQGPQ